MHRDYSGATSGIVKVFDDKIQIYNSGKLPPGLTVPMLLRGDYTSTPRNVQVADMFKEAGVIERYGSGIGRIVDDFKAYGLAAPEFKEVGESFIVTVSKTRLPGFHPNTIQKGLVERLAESQKKILTLVQANPNISKKDLAAAVGISTTAIDKNISALKAKGLLKRVGPDKGGHWSLLEAGRG